MLKFETGVYNVIALAFLAAYFSEKVNMLKQSGAEVISLTAGTMHIVFDEIEKMTSVSLVSIPKQYVRKLYAENTKKLDCLELSLQWKRII